MLEILTNWFKVKFKIHNKNSGRSYVSGEIYWCAIGHNVGSEVYGKGDTFSRPVLILKKFNSNLAWVVPLSSKIKTNPYSLIFSFNNKQISAMVSQVRTIDTKRLENKMGQLKSSEFERIKNEIFFLLK